MEGNLQGVCKWTEGLKKKMSTGGCLPQPRGYIHVYDHNIQTSSSETAWPVRANLYMEHRKERGMKVNINGSGHVTKMAINSKNLYKSYSSEPEDL